MDRQYFDQMRKQIAGLMETLEITMDRELFNQILAAGEWLEEDLRLGRLDSLAGES